MTRRAPERITFSGNEVRDGEGVYVIRRDEEEVGYIGYGPHPKIRSRRGWNIVVDGRIVAHRYYLAQAKETARELFA